MAESRQQPRVAAARILLAVAALALLWALVQVMGGGVEFYWLGQRVRSNEPMRSVAVAALALAGFIPLYGAARAHDVWSRATRRFNDGWTAAGLAAFILVVGAAYSSTAATGSDSYGYVSQANQWLTGELQIPQPWVTRVPWPTKAWSFTPLGYRPLDEAHQDVLVPTYSPGLPLLMAAAMRVGGYGAAFLVVPISAALLVYVTYGIGRRLGSRRDGLIGAWFVATSPVVVYMMMVPMTDVPVAAAWATALFFVLGTSWRSAGAAGLATAAAVLIRPNLAPLAGVLAIVYVLRPSTIAQARGSRITQRLGKAAVYCAGAACGVAATMLINRRLYGSPFVSGYGDVSGYFSWRNVLPNLRLYGGWLLDVQTPLILAGLAAVFVPRHAWWPEVRQRTFFVVAALFILATWALYCAYLQFEFWTYLRFLLPTWPLVMIGMGAFALWLARGAPAGRRLAVTGAVLYLGLFEYRAAAHRGAFDVWKNERASVVIAKRVGDVTEPGSVILSMSHSGSVRYYAGRTTLRYDLLDRDWLDRAIDWLAGQGAHPYLLVNDWELPRFTERFGTRGAAAFVGGQPVFTYEGAGRTFLFDLMPHAASPAVVLGFTGAPGSERSVPPVAPPKFLEGR